MFSFRNVHVVQESCCSEILKNCAPHMFNVFLPGLFTNSFPGLCELAYVSMKYFKQNLEKHRVI